MSLKLSDDAQMWADKTYARSVRQIDKEYQEKLAQFSMGLTHREDVERRHGTYGYIEARILANMAKAKKKAEILRQAYNPAIRLCPGPLMLLIPSHRIKERRIEFVSLPVPSSPFRPANRNACSGKELFKNR